MSLSIVQSKLFAVLLAHFLAEGIFGSQEESAEELGIPFEDYDDTIHWPRLCAKRALAALRAVENEVASAEGR